MNSKERIELLEKIKTLIVEESHKETDIKVVKGLHKAEKIIDTELNSKALDKN